MVQVMAREVDFIYIPLDNTIANAMQTVVQEANKSKTPIITSQTRWWNKAVWQRSDKINLR